MLPFLDKISAQIQKIPTKARLVGFGVFIGILAGLFLYFVHIPKKTQIDRLEADIKGLQVTIKSNEEKIRNLTALKAEVRDLESRLKMLTEQLPPEKEVTPLLKQIQNLASQTGLTMKLWRPEKRKTDASGMYDEIPITVELTGGYHDVGIFFDRVSKMTRIVNMVNLKMTGAARNKAGALEIKVGCTAKTFAAAEKKPDAPTPAPKVVKKAN